MASFLDSLFGAFTGEPAMQAAAQARATLSNTYGEILANNRNNRAEGLQDITTAGETGRAAVAPYFQDATGQIRNYNTNAINQLGDIYGQPLDQTSGMYANALGLGGAAGTAAAQNAFQAGPGYQFQLGQGLDAITRGANAAGMGASGNMLREAQTYGQGLANQEYNRWLGNLQGRESLYAPLASRQTDVMTETGRNLGALDTAQAQFYNQSYQDEANRRAAQRLGFAGLDVGAAGIFGPAMASTDLAIGAAQQQAGANTVNTISNAVSGLGGILSPGR